MNFADWLRTKGYADRTVAEYDKWARRWERHCWAHDTTAAGAPVRLLTSWAQALPNGRDSRQQASSSLIQYHAYIGRDDGAEGAIKVPPKPPTRTEALPQDEARALRDAAVLIGGRQGTATLLGLYTGARRSEIAAFRWDGVDFRRERIGWERAKHGGHAKLLLHPVLAKALLRLPASGSPYLFPGNNGRPHVGANTVWTWIRSVGEACGVDVRPHELRATWITELTDHVGVLEAGELVGHRDPRVTLHYVRGRQDRKDAAVAAVLGHTAHTTADRRTVDLTTR